jgi:hypothetical protein
MNHPFDQVINPTITLAQVYPNAGFITSTHLQGTSISTPISTIFYSTALHVPHDPIGTSLQLRMKTPTSPTQLARGKPPSKEPFPPEGIRFHGRPTPPGGQPPFHAPPGGQPLLTSHSLVVNPPPEGGNLCLLENLHNPGEYLQKALSFNPKLGGTYLIIH